MYLNANVLSQLEITTDFPPVPWNPIQCLFEPVRSVRKWSENSFISPKLTDLAQFAYLLTGFTDSKRHLIGFHGTGGLPVVTACWLKTPVFRYQHIQSFSSRLIPENGQKLLKNMSKSVYIFGHFYVLICLKILKSVCISTLLSSTNLK